ncbi:hypothetical protein HJG60_011071 [Phyllostomus discolor]|uniref:Uncharacterized protein n=1 Tax=Phyllostomus discolor TaxID=89673 RepID=A0A834AI05_9CHIR|nr:hypothetical protein HJG60_011071 [Phyllostomus discolor]
MGWGRAAFGPQPAGSTPRRLPSLQKEPGLRQKRKRRKPRGDCLDGRPSHVHPCPLAGPTGSRWGPGLERGCRGPASVCGFWTLCRKELTACVQAGIPGEVSAEDPAVPQVHAVQAGLSHVEKVRV